MTGSDDARVSATATEWRAESRYYRRPPGWGWLLGLLLIPLLLGLIGWGTLSKPKVSVSTPSIGITAPSISVPSLPSLNFAPLSILRNGNDFTLTGDLPDLNVKTALLNALKAAFGSGVNLIDKLNIKAGVSSPDFSGLGGLFKAAVDVAFFASNDPICEHLDHMGLRYEFPDPEAGEHDEDGFEETFAGPGMDPDKPPMLK